MRRLLVTCLSMLLLIANVYSVQAKPLNIPVVYYKLPNGLKVVISEDHNAPVVTVAVYYNVGMRLEPKGRTGFAHLFEHMMFQGSANVKKFEHAKFVEANGGSLNGHTDFDYTNYYQTMPSNRVELGIWLESDRMRSLDISEENLKELKRLNESLADQGALFRKTVQDRQIQDEAMRGSLKEISDRLAEVGERLQGMQASGVAALPPAAGTGPAPLTPPAGEAAGPPGATPAATPPPPAPRELYSQAYADYARGNYDVAIQGFTQYQRHPAAASDLIDNAQYWIGESYYGKKAYAEAIAAWDGLFRDYPASDKLPDARVKKGMALEKMGRRRDAQREYRLVMDRYPNSPAARIARDHLNP